MNSRKFFGNKLSQPSQPRTPKPESEDAKICREWRERMGSVLHAHDWNAEEAAETFSIQILGRQSQYYAGRKLTKDGMLLVAAACELWWHEFLVKIPGLLERATVTSGDYGYNASNYVSWRKTIGSFSRTYDDAVSTIKCLYTHGLCNLFVLNAQSRPENVLESLLNNKKALGQECMDVMYMAYTNPSDDADLTRPMVDILNKVDLCATDFGDVNGAICLSWLCLVRPEQFVKKVFVSCCGFFNEAPDKDAGGFPKIHNICESLRRIPRLAQGSENKRGFAGVFAQKALGDNFLKSITEALNKLTMEDIVKLFMQGQSVEEKVARENALKVHSAMLAEFSSDEERTAYIRNPANVHLLQYYVMHLPFAFVSKKEVWDDMHVHRPQFSLCELARLQNKHRHVFREKARQEQLERQEECSSSSPPPQPIMRPSVTASVRQSPAAFVPPPPPRFLKRK